MGENRLIQLLVTFEKIFIFVLPWVCFFAVFVVKRHELAALQELCALNKKKDYEFCFLVLVLLLLIIFV